MSAVFEVKVPPNSCLQILKSDKLIILSQGGVSPFSFRGQDDVPVGVGVIADGVGVTVTSVLLLKETTKTPNSGKVESGVKSIPTGLATVLSVIGMLTVP